MDVTTTRPGKRCRIQPRVTAEYFFPWRVHARHSYPHHTNWPDNHPNCMEDDTIRRFLPAPLPCLLVFICPLVSSGRQLSPCVNSPPPRAAAPSSALARIQSQLSTGVVANCTVLYCVPSVGRALAALWSVGGYKVEVTIIFALWKCEISSCWQKHYVKCTDSTHNQQPAATATISTRSRGCL